MSTEKPFQWFEMKNVSADKAEVVIYDQIGKNWWDDSGVTAQGFLQDLRKLGDVKNITLRINSPGGNMMDGNTIYNLLVAHSATIDVIVDGYAASAASIIAMAGDTISMPENAMMMIHNPASVVRGDANQMRKQADTMDLMKKGAVLTYAKRTGLSEDRISKMMDDETWMTAAQAQANGFADTITDAVEIKNSFDWGKQNLPAPPDLGISPRMEVVTPPNVTINPKEPDMSVTPPAGTVTMTQEQLNQAINEAVNKASAPIMASVVQERLDNVRREFASMVSSGNLTPAQSRMFGQLAENVIANDQTINFSMKDDGSDVKTGTAMDLLRSVAMSMKPHNLLREQVATADGVTQVPAAHTIATTRNQLATESTLSKSDVPENSQKLPESHFQDQYIKNVLMAAQPGLSYKDAALMTEKDPAYADALKKFLRS